MLTCLICIPVETHFQALQKNLNYTEKCTPSVKIGGAKFISVSIQLSGVRASLDIHVNISK